MTVLIALLVAPDTLMMKYAEKHYGSTSIKITKVEPSAGDSVVSFNLRDILESGIQIVLNFSAMRVGRYIAAGVVIALIAIVEAITFPKFKTILCLSYTIIFVSILLIFANELAIWSLL